MLRSGPDKSALLGEDEPEDKFMWVRLIATVVAVSLGSSLQFGFATGSLNNLEQVRAHGLAAATTAAAAATGSCC